MWEGAGSGEGGRRHPPAQAKVPSTPSGWYSSPSSTVASPTSAILARSSRVSSTFLDLMSLHHARRQGKGAAAVSVSAPLPPLKAHKMPAACVLPAGTCCRANGLQPQP